MTENKNRRTLPLAAFGGWVALLSSACLAACAGPSSSEGLAGPTSALHSTAAGREVELASLMGELQRHSAKLGYSIAGSNGPLAEFYLHELEEVLEKVYELEEHDGMPIGAPAGVIMRQLVIDLDERLDSAEWPSAERSYRALIAGCNRCHTATEHAFLEILPATGSAPFNQRFEVAGSTND